MRNLVLSFLFLLLFSTVASAIISANIVVNQQPTCPNYNNGKMSATVSGGIAPYVYTWSNGAHTSTISNLVEDNYDLTVTDFIGNAYYVSRFLSSKIAAVSLSITNKPTCPNFNNGKITSSGIVNMAAPYTYLWSNGATTSIASNLSEGTYQLTVSNTAGCKAIKSINLFKIIPSTGISVVQRPTCPSFANGKIAFSYMSTGSAPYTFLWSNGATTDTLRNATQGTYSLTVTDSNGCIAISSSVSLYNDAYNASIDIVKHPFCNGTNDGIIRFSNSNLIAPYTFLWSNGATTDSLKNIKAGDYYLTVNDVNGCSVTTGITLNGTTYYQMFASKISDATCPNFNNGKAAITYFVSPATPYTYLWSNGTTKDTVSNLVSGNYLNSCTVTDANGCFASNSNNLIISDGPTPTIQIWVHKKLSCQNSNDGKLRASQMYGGDYPYTYQWSNGGTTEVITNLSSQSYSLTMTDSKGCTATASATLGFDTPYAYIQTIQNITTCGNNGVLQATMPYNTSPPYTYLWSNGATTGTVYNLTSNTYYVTVTDVNGCSATASTSLSGNSYQHTATIGIAKEPCSGQSNGSLNVYSFSSNVTPFTYLWSNGATTSTLNNIPAGNYALTITDANGCSAVNSIYLRDSWPFWVSAQALENATCPNYNNGKAAILYTSSTSTPLTYLWSNGTTTDTVKNMTPGRYDLTVTDANGCTGVASYSWSYIDIQKNEPYPYIYQIKSPSCPDYNNGKLESYLWNVGTSPQTYQWSNGATTASIDNLKEGFYTVTMTNAIGCKGNAEYYLKYQKLSTSISTLKTPSCPSYNNGKLTSSIPVGGTAPFVFRWSNGATTDTITNLTKGNYSVTITDANGCSAVATTILSNNTANVSIYTVKEPTCPTYNDGKVMVSSIAGGTMPFAYIWNNGATTDSISNLSKGVFKVTVTDTKGCVASNSITLTDFQPELYIYPIYPSCPNYNNGSVMFSYFGSTAIPFTYQWSNGETTPSISNLSKGNYTLTVTDANGCKAVQTRTLADYTQRLDGEIKNPSCATGTDGQILLYPLGPGLDTYLWSNGATTGVISNLSVGTYYVTITSFQGCTMVDSIKLAKTYYSPLNITKQQPICPSYNNGLVYLQPNLRGQITYLWSNGSTDYYINNLKSGTYHVTVTNPSSNCIFKESIQLDSIPPKLHLGKKNPTCNNSSDGIIYANYFENISSTNSWNFQWNTGFSSSNSQLKGLSNGNYSVTFTNSAGCVATASTTLRSTGLDDIGINGFDKEYCPNNNVALSAQNLHGIKWSSGSQSYLANYTTANQTTTHWVKGISEMGCSFQDTFMLKVRQNSPPIFNYSINGLTVKFHNIYNYVDSVSWNFGDGSAVSSIKNPTHTYATAGKFAVQLLTKDSCGRALSRIDTIDFNKYILLNAKVILEGAYRSNLGMMGDDLRQGALLPLAAPYGLLGFNNKNGGGDELTTPNILNNSTIPTVVDWIFLELRDAANSSNVIATRAALLRQDGTIVDTDGTSDVRFTNIDSKSYFLAIRHRNHLGLRTLNTINFSKNAVNLDFTDNNIALYGINSLTPLSYTLFGMNGADANSDGSVDSFDSAIWEIQNGNFDDYNFNADYNLDTSIDAVDSVLWEINNGKFEELD